MLKKKTQTLQVISLSVKRFALFNMVKTVRSHGRSGNTLKGCTVTIPMQDPQKGALQPFKEEVTPLYRNNTYCVIVSSFQNLDKPVLQACCLSC